MDVCKRKPRGGEYRGTGWSEKEVLDILKTIRHGSPSTPLYELPEEN